MFGAVKNAVTPSKIMLSKTLLLNLFVKTCAFMQRKKHLVLLDTALNTVSFWPDDSYHWIF